MLTRAEARTIVEAFLDTEIRARFDHDIMIVNPAVRDRGDAWIFPYNGRAYVERDDWREMLAGNVPIAVDKETGVDDFAR